MDFYDPDTYYNVSTVNYLAAGSCNFNDSGVSLWPLDQIVHDTQYYVRDAVIGYIDYKGTVSPAIEGRLSFATNYIISGSLGAAGAGGIVTYTGGSTTADPVTGAYSFFVPGGWSGTVTPGKPGVSFAPAGRSYASVAADVAGQDYAVLPPTVGGISPSSGPTAGGTLVIITGSGFPGATAVTFGPAGSSGFTIHTPALITATSPPGTSGMIVDVTVTTPAGTSAVSSADEFIYAQPVVAKNITSEEFYVDLLTALSAAPTGSEIRMLDTQLSGNFILDRAITLNGGWNISFLSSGDQPTTLQGSLTINGGASTVKTVVVKGKLVVEMGSLRVNDVTIQP